MNRKNREEGKALIKRKKIRIVMAGIFCIGVLMGGLGTGIAFAEFSGFAYQPITAPPEAFQTEKFIYLMPEEENKPIWMQRYLGGALCRTESREEIPEGQIEINITYNTQACSLEFTDYQDSEDNLHLHFYLDSGGDFENFMKVKDDFLDGLRKRQLRDYQVEYVRSVEIWVNPKDKNRICWN